MAIVNILENFNPETNAVFVEKAESLRPKLIKTKTKPISIVEIYKGKNDWECNKIGEIDELSGFHLGKSDKVCVDFGGHRVGYVRIKLSYVGSPPDAPAYIRVKLGEHLCEIGEETSDYNGIISSSWLQEEFLHIDILPADIRMPRRYAFRYLEILVKDTSPKFKIVIDSIECKAVSSVDLGTVKPLKGEDTELNQIDSIAVKTLADCMQSVFEDGPKRDRRLWLGDLRLQALANYATFDNKELVRRCLYLFAGMTTEDGRISANVFVKPKNIPDDTFLFEYSLFFISTLYDLNEAHPDIKIVKELYPTCKKQMDITLGMFDENGKLIVDEDYPVFVDWSNEFNKDTAGQAETIYVLKQFIELAKLAEDEELAKYEEALELISSYAKKQLYNEEKKLFVTTGNEYNIASQVWMVLAKVMSPEENKEIMKAMIDQLFPVKNIATPYMYHHIVEALFEGGLEEEAIQLMKDYWGKMIDLGADTFWEAFDPDQPDYSPYGSPILNSYCHAWSCTPVYLIHKYILKDF